MQTFSILPGMKNYTPGLFLYKIALTGLALTVPFIVMELVNRRDDTYDFPFLLFLVLWLLAGLFFVLTFSLYHDLKHTGVKAAKTLKFTGKIILVLGVFTLWLLVVKDQMPCFLGIGNCD